MTRRPHEPAVRWTDPHYAALQEVLRKRSGLIFQPLRRITVEAAAERVMQHVGLRAPEDFLPLLAQDGAVFDDMMAEITIGETYFFREPSHFALLRRTVLPEYRARALHDQKFRAWSAACSTGEEAYSIAIALREEGVASAVVATDVSRARLSAARRGEYRQWSFRGVSEQTVSRYFTRRGDVFALSGEVKRDVDFRYLNLAADSYPSMACGVWGMDLILCRNVLIYFDRDTIEHVAKSLLASLGDHGWLLLGATDPPLHEYVRCEVVQTEAGLAYRHFRGTAHRSLRPTPSAPAVRPAIAPLPVAVEPEPVAPMAYTPRVPAASAALVQSPLHAADAATAGSAAAAYAARDYDGTIALLAGAAQRGAAAIGDLLLFVRSLANVGRLEEAGVACAAALDRHRDVAELHYLHAVLVAQAGQFAESARAAKRAIYLDRSMVVAHLALGSALASEGDTEAALRAFDASERLLSAMPADSLVPGTDGEPAGRLLEMTRVQVALARREDAA